MAEAYQNRSIAEQNSIDLAWCELSREKYQNLTKCICATENELRRFRQLTVNLVMATDIFDKNMKKLQNRRWDKAFHYRSAATSSERPITPLSLEEDRNMRATVVIEHIVSSCGLVISVDCEIALMSFFFSH
jgi:3'5'-cyclic nucleotide phosphodiesterase